MTRAEQLLETLRWGQRYGREIPHAQHALYDAVVALLERAIQDEQLRRAPYDAALEHWHGIGFIVSGNGDKTE